MESTQKLRTHGITAARDYQDLPAWQKSVDLAERIYGLREDRAGIVAHMRNTALSIAGSLAAASGRHNEVGMLDSYSKAQSANAELMTQLTIAGRIGHLGADEVAEMIAVTDEISRLIVGLKHGLKVAAKDKANAEKDAARADREHRKERDFKKRDRDDRPRREFKDRGERPDREERQYKRSDRGEDRPRREYKPRDDRGGDERSERKPYRDKKSYGDRKPYGDKKPYGGKPRGDKPYRKRDRD